MHGSANNAVAGDEIIYVGAISVLRDGLTEILAHSTVARLTAAYDTVAAAISSCAKPQIVLLDMGSPTDDSSRDIAALKQGYPGVGVLALGHARDRESIRKVYAAAADAYVLKDDDHRELVFAIECLLRGRTYVSSSVCHTVVGGFINACSIPAPDESTVDALSDRERQVMRMIALGYRTREMAAKLSLSPKTIEKHRMNLMRKLGVNSAPAVAAYAITHGYVTI